MFRRKDVVRVYTQIIVSYNLLHGLLTIVKLFISLSPSVSV